MLLNNVIAALPNFVFWKNKDLKYLGCNDNAAALLDFTSPAQILDKTDYDLPWKNYFIEQIQRCDKEVINTGIPKQDVSEVLALTNGKTIEVITSRIPFRDDNGGIAGVLIVSVEVTKCNLHSQSFFEHILKSLPYYIFWKNKESVYLGCNSNFATLVGKTSPNEVIGLTDFDLNWAEGEAQFYRDADRKVMREQDQIHLEEILQRPDGSQIVMLVSKVPVRNKETNIIGMLGISTDITKIKKVERELKEAKENAEAANNVIKIFASSIAHELRTPLATISANIYGINKYFPSLIETYQLAKDAKLLIPKIRVAHYQSLKTLSDNIESEINYAKIIIDMLLMKTNSKFADNILEICSIEKCVEKALSRYPFASKEEENLIKLDMSENFLFNGIEIFMVHVIFNLIKNSLYYIKAIRKGGVTIWFKKGKTHNYLYFKDTAKGIGKEVLPHIFDSYFSQTPYGAGIGLAFCKQVMRNFLGDIECESKEGEYTKFILKFPKSL